MQPTCCVIQVTLEENTIGGPASKVEVTILGVAPNGYLLAADKSGQQFELHPDGNRYHQIPPQHLMQILPIKCER